MGQILVVQTPNEKMKKNYKPLLNTNPSYIRAEFYEKKPLN